MPLSYDFLAPQQIVFGWGRRKEAGALARTLGRRAFIVCGAAALEEQGHVAEIGESLRSSGVEPVPVATISREPEVGDVDRLAADLRARGVGAGDLLLAVGGGAAIDLAKALAAMATNTQSTTVRDYLEGVGRGLKLEVQPLPIMSMPATAGTGAEATKNAVISCYDPPFKKSLRDQRLLPRIALLDPELTVSVPAAVTAASGMDAITQLIESYISKKAQPIPQALAVQGLQMALPSIAEAVEHGDRRQPREMMAHAALLSGMALANAGLGMAHGVAAALGVHRRTPHGVACALMLPVALRVNRQVCLAELARLWRLLAATDAMLSDDEAADRLIRRIEALCDRVGVPRRLSQVGATAGQIPAIVRSSRGASMSGNPRDLSDDELTAILEEIL
jgi:alcohol dehydrogenase class IV